MLQLRSIQSSKKACFHPTTAAGSTEGGVVCLASWLCQRRQWDRRRGNNDASWEEGWCAARVKMIMSSTVHREIITAAAAFLSLSRAFLQATQMSNCIRWVLPKFQAACCARGIQIWLRKFLPTGNSPSCGRNRQVNQQSQFNNYRSPEKAQGQALESSEYCIYTRVWVVQAITWPHFPNEKIKAYES